MDKNKKNRSGSQSNETGKNENRSSKKQVDQPGAPQKSNRHTGERRRDESEGSDMQTSKKGPNSL